jgi:hypothetical protein
VRWTTCRTCSSARLLRVAVVISDKGRKRALRALPGRHGRRDNYHDRIIIFRDTLLRDFGHTRTCCATRSRAPCATSWRTTSAPTSSACGSSAL